MNCQVYYTNYLAYNTFKEIKKHWSMPLFRLQYFKRNFNKCDFKNQREVDSSRIFGGIRFQFLFQYFRVYRLRK